MNRFEWITPDWKPQYFDCYPEGTVFHPLFGSDKRGDAVLELDGDNFILRGKDWFFADTLDYYSKDNFLRYYKLVA